MKVNEGERSWGGNRQLFLLPFPSLKAQRSPLSSLQIIFHVANLVTKFPTAFYFGC